VFVVCMCVMWVCVCVYACYVYVCMCVWVSVCVSGVYVSACVYVCVVEAFLQFDPAPLMFSHTPFLCTYLLHRRCSMA
jgi:hypothetical protein